MPQINNIEENEANYSFLPPVVPFDIVSQVWNAPVNTTIGMLLSNESYRQDLSIALNTINNININEVKPIDTTATKITMRINEQTVQATLDSGAAMSIISDRLA